jgi:putative addiction module killer protein
MLAIFRTDEFDRWLKKLKDTRAKAKIIVRIERLAHGNAGDVAPVGEGLSELKIDYGPGYRVYYKRSGDSVEILWAGTKASQSADIEKAKALAAE